MVAIASVAYTVRRDLAINLHPATRERCTQQYYCTVASRRFILAKAHRVVHDPYAMYTPF